MITLIRKDFRNNIYTHGLLRVITPYMDIVIKIPNIHIDKWEELERKVIVWEEELYGCSEEVIIKEVKDKLERVIMPP